MDEHGDHCNFKTSDKNNFVRLNESSVAASLYVYFTVPSRPGLEKPSRLLQSQQCVCSG
jgi:hypothetical protein